MNDPTFEQQVSEALTEARHQWARSESERYELFIAPRVAAAIEEAVAQKMVNSGLAHGAVFHGWRKAALAALRGEP